MSLKRSDNKIVVFGSCSVDFTTYAPRLPYPGETLHGTKFTTSYGGKGANQCVAAAKLGANCYIICRVGDDQWGEKYNHHLKEMGVNVSHVCVTPKVTTGIAQIMVAESGENQIVIVPGANGYLSKNDVLSAKEAIIDADVLIGQLETPFESTLEAFKICKGVKLLNAAPARKDIDDILPYCSILCLNETEASLLTGLSVTLKNGIEALKKLLSTGCESVIITLGEQGAIYASKSEPPTHVPCQPVKAIDTTGAGDAFVGALATYMVSHKGMAMHQIIGAACDVASMSVMKEGTQTSYPSQFTPFNREYNHIILQ